jgi:hypothetical protein
MMDGLGELFDSFVEFLEQWVASIVAAILALLENFFNIPD